MGVIIWRLAFLQIARHEELAEKAARQRHETQTIKAARGVIVDRHGSVLAESIETETVKADLHQIDVNDFPAVIKLLAEKLGEAEANLRKLFESGSKDLTVAKKVSPEITHNLRRSIEELKDPKEIRKFTGVKIVREPQRHYPNGTLGAHVLGYINAAQNGVAGLEARLDVRLRGQDGKLQLEKDAAGRPFSSTEQESLAGARLITTIDVGLQHKAEIALAQAVKNSNAKGGSVIILEPGTGEILVLANAPTFDPKDAWKKTEEQEFIRRNRAITDPYEPGSVFKIVPYAAAIEEGLVRPADKIHCGNGQIAIARRIVHDAHPYGELSIAEALAKSSNVAAIKLGLRLGKEKLSEYVFRFGFGQRTGIDLPGESKGIVNPHLWTLDSMGSIPMGHEISVTALQAVAAMAAIANRGKWIQPHLVRRVVTSDAGQHELWKAQPETRQVVSEQTADTIKNMLTGVVESGTARHAIQLAGYSAAGKTGTAQKVENKTYSNSAYVASFAGFVPATTPRFAIIVMLDDPQGAHQGGQVAAPVFNQIAQAALGDYGVLPDMEEFRQKMSEAQDKLRAKPARQLEAAPTPIKAVATPKASVKPTPLLAKAKATPKPTPVLKLPVAKPPVKTAAATKPEPAKSPAAKPAARNAPNVVGRSLREVASLCSQAGLKLKALGSGVAKSQRRVGDTLIVEFR